MKHAHLLRAVILATALGMASPLRAATVTGVVRDQSAQAQSGARVTLVTQDTSLVLEERSGAAGTYAFAGVGPGGWTLGASKLGLAYAETVIVVASADVTHDFTLGQDQHPGRWSVIGDTDPENLYATDSGSLLPDGRILYCHDTLDPVIFDPVARTKTFPAASPSQQGCHITTLLADGRLVFVGGQDSGDFRDAVKTVKTYDFRNGGWTLLPDLNQERWYPGLARLPDGRLLAMGGGQRPNAQRTPTCEIYDPVANIWTPSASMSNPSDYPPAVLLYTGEVLRSWWPPQLYDIAADQWRDTGGFVQAQRFWPGHCDHTLVLLADGRACAVGILRGSLTNPSMIELYDRANETWTLGANAQVTRSQPEVVMLPTGEVFVAGGRLEDPNPSVPTNAFGQVKLTDLYDPVGNLWRRCADMAWFREYHAVTVLVPDGRVVTTAGTGGPAQPGVSNDVEAFEPPYLFRGIRPRIDAISGTTLANGATVPLAVSRTDSVTAVVMVGTDATTHWVNGGVPRVLSLGYQQAGSTVVATVPSDPNRAPVGYYILFALVDDIPSQGVIVRIPDATVTGVAPPVLRSRLRVSPNPFVAETQLNWYQARRGPVRIAAYDLLGRRSFQVELGERPAGQHSWLWASEGRALPAGITWIEVDAAGALYRAKAVRLER